jgi:DNA-binding NarL/FixJ family response regulator
MIRIAIVDDHPLARLGVQQMFATADDIELVAVTGDPGALSAAQRLDVVVTDLYLFGETLDLSAVREFTRWSRVLVMSASARQSDVLAALRAGADGYLTKHAEEAEFGAAVRAVAAGGFYLSSTLADLLQTDVRQERTPAPSLSPQEEKVLSYIARGFTHGQTASRMGIKPATVDTYVERIRRKLGLGNKAELTRHAIEMDLRRRE